MSSTKRSRYEAHEQRPVHPRRGMSRYRKIYTTLTKKCTTFVGFLGTSIGVMAALLSLFGHLPGSPDTKIYTDEHLKIKRLDERRFEFQLTLTLMNEGPKPDTIRRPHVAFKSDRPIISCSPEVTFKYKQEDVIFPLILQKDTPVQLTCSIEWSPSSDYDKWTSDEPERTAETKSAVLGRIEVTWPGENQWRIERPFALLAAETIRELKPDVPLSINYLYLGNGSPGAEDGGTHSTVPSSSLLHGKDGEFMAAGFEMGGVTRLASMLTLTPPVQAATSARATTRYAAQGEIASGREVSAPNAAELVVNIRPCGGAEELVVFRAQFRKRVLGTLPCGGMMVQVQKL